METNDSTRAVHSLKNFRGADELVGSEIVTCRVKRAFSIYEFTQTENLGSARLLL